MTSPSPGLGTVFNEASDGFAVWTPLLWDPVGRATVDTVGLRPGERVLDACCGNGASAIPAGEAVGRDGRVDAVDLAERLLTSGRERAEAAGLPQVRFHTGDVTRWTAPDSRRYEVLLCVFGVFFLPDMDAAVTRLLQLLRPGGRFAFTVWARGSLEPLVAPFVKAVGTELAAAGQAPPTPSPARRAAERLGSPEGMADWLDTVGAVSPEVRPVGLDIPLTPELAWNFVTGAAPRAMLHGLDEKAVGRVRAQYVAELARQELDVFHASALIGLGSRPV